MQRQIIRFTVTARYEKKTVVRYNKAACSFTGNKACTFWMEMNPGIMGEAGNSVRAKGRDHNTATQ